MENRIPAKTDVLIVGAGPAGSTLAYEMARLGANVVLLDKAKFPRGKTCAGGLNQRTVRLLPFDITPVVERVITGISFTRNLEEPLLRRYAEPLMVTVLRENFDALLVRQAVQAGARLLDGSAFKGLADQGETVQVETTSGALAARFVVGADGAHSPVAKSLDLIQKQSYILAIHSEVPISLFPWLEQDMIHIDWGSHKRGYAYLFPKRNTLSIGAGGFGISPTLIKNYQRAFLETYSQKEETQPFSTAGYILPLRRKRRAIQKGSCLLLGDAAGLVDPFTGEGIYCAVRSAQIAAPVLAEALRGNGRSLHLYQERIDRELMPELESARFVREIFNLRPAYFHRKLATNDRWWNAMARILRGERTFLDVKKKLGPLGKILLRMGR
jgi:geranylgeranyl reductase family protein